MASYYLLAPLVKETTTSTGTGTLTLAAVTNFNRFSDITWTGGTFYYFIRQTTQWEFGIGSISGSCIGSFLFIACSEWWLRFLDNETYIGAFKVPLLRTGFRMVVFSVIIMIVVLFFRKGIMGTRELSLAGLADRLRKESAKGGKQA